MIGDSCCRRLSRLDARFLLAAALACAVWLLPTSPDSDGATWGVDADRDAGTPLRDGSKADRPDGSNSGSQRSSAASMISVMPPNALQVFAVLDRQGGVELRQDCGRERRFGSTWWAVERQSDCCLSLVDSDGAVVSRTTCVGVDDPKILFLSEKSSELHFRDGTTLELNRRGAMVLAVGETSPLRGFGVKAGMELLSVEAEGYPIDLRDLGEADLSSKPASFIRAEWEPNPGASTDRRIRFQVGPEAVKPDRDAPH